jgi:hypothetical protein
MKFCQRNRTRRFRIGLKRSITRKKGGGNVFKRHGNPIKVDLVIARYKEKLDWVKEYLPKEFHKIHVYNKGPQNVTCEDIAPQKSCKVYDMSDKNVGVCDHTYLYHIIENWDNLADVTVFCPGSIYLPYKRQKFDRTLNKIVETGDTVFIAANNRGDMGRTVKEIFSDFVLDSHLVANTSNRNNAGKSVVAPAKDRPFGVWYDKHVGTVIYGYSLWGIFAASKEHIKQRPKSFYENLIKQVSSNKHEEASHFMERAWGGIINAPFHFFNNDDIGNQYLDPMQKAGGSAPIKLGVLAIFKNEEGAIREWIEHYKWQGVDEIVMLDNNSTDGWKGKLHGLMDHVTIIPAPEPHAQLQNYEKYGLPVLKKLGVNVLTILDLDEFMFGTDGKSLKEHVKEIFGSSQRPSLISYRWQQFGSSGLKEQPASIRKSFIWRAKDAEEYFKKRDNLTGSYKTILWLDDLVKIDHHNPVMKEGTKKLLLADAPKGIQVNHYRVQSEKWYLEVKGRRGNVYHSEKNIKEKNAKSTNSAVRNVQRFKNEDTNEVEDTLLRDLVVKHEKGQRGGSAHDRELVVARYNENVDWIKDLPKGFFTKIRLYNKGPPLETPLEGIETITLENKGWQYNTVLQHIIRNYNNLAEVTVFVPGTVMKKEYKKKQFEAIMERLRDKDESFIIGMKKTTAETREEMGFSVQEYKASNDNNRSAKKNTRVNKSGHSTLGEWVEAHFPGEKLKCISYNSTFAVSRKDILKRPVEVYQKLLNEVSSAHPEAEHFMERVTSLIFSISRCELHEWTSSYFSHL